jgi:hypothetical protein
MKYLINPFERIAGWQALFTGIAVMALTVVIGKINQIAFVSVLNVVFGATINYSSAFALQTANFLILFVMIWLAGVCFSKSKLRVIDIAGTLALAHAPLLLLTIIYFLPVTPTGLYDASRSIISHLISIPFLIWMIALMYSAYSVSCHLKGSRSIISFIGALFVAFSISFFVSFFLLSSLFANAPIKNVFRSGSKENIVLVTTDSITIRQKTENVVKAFEQGDFDAITVCFDETVKKGLPSNSLKMLWIQLNLLYGQFEKADWDNLKEASTEKYVVVVVPLVFPKEKLNLQLAFSKEDGKIGGLYLRPSSQ